MTTPASIADFMSAAPAPLNGSSRWASRYAAELRKVVHEAAAYAPRSLQVHLGPSELGVECDRQVVLKLLGTPHTNHVADPWPSFVGSAVHVRLAEAFEEYNRRHNTLRFVAEQRVVPHPDHSGTADLYDALWRAVVDHKVLGETSMDKVRSVDGPPRKYRAQLFLYGLGYLRLGLPVDRVVLAAYPRTKPSLDTLYVWEAPFDADAEALLEQVFADTHRRKLMAASVANGTFTGAIPHAPSDDECYFCPFYRPQAASDSGPGCPGNRAKP